ncbi:MAG: sigma 54-interacting transcriptional regulator, partial [Polyangiaceae bacterium]
EDLSSANGTRVRDLPLQPGAAVEIFPDDVVDLGAVLLVVQYRRIEQRLRRSCDRTFFEVRVEEERERAAADGPPFAVATLEVEGGLGSHAIQLLLATELNDEDLVSSSGPGKYDLLWLATSPADAAERLDRVVTRLGQRSLRARGQLDFYPRDERTPGERAQLPSRAASAWRTRRHEIVVVDQTMQRVYKLLQRIADSELSLLLIGSPGAGKALCAEYVHDTSARSGGPFVTLNCSVLPESLLEGELFGQRSADGVEKTGLLESTHGGTLVLDGVGDLPLTTQIKLLRALETREVSFGSASSARPIDVRVLATTTQDLNERVTSGLFREDLYYRLNGISVIVPPLRERVDDIEPLARFFSNTYPKADSPVPGLSEASIDLLESHHWPGNVRELRACIERARVLCEGPSIEPVHLALVSRPSERHVPRTPDLRNEVRTLERERIERALADNQGNQRRAAEALGLSRGALLRRLELLGIPRPRKGN